jgi:Tfp pilus assembly protein PilX
MKLAIQHPRARQRGVVLIFTLIVLLILTIGAVALMRSMNTSLFNAGNLAFRRDLVNQGELAVATVINEFKTTCSTNCLSSTASTEADNAAFNYYAETLPTTTQGIPTVLLGTVANPISGAAGSGILIYYVIDRLCQAAGPTVASQCVQSSAAPLATTVKNQTPLTPPSATVYRLSIRVNGPRSTQVFLQTTFTRAD